MPAAQALMDFAYLIMLQLQQNGFKVKNSWKRYVYLIGTFTAVMALPKYFMRMIQFSISHSIAMIMECFILDKKEVQNWLGKARVLAITFILDLITCTINKSLTLIISTLAIHSYSPLLKNFSQRPLLYRVDLILHWVMVLVELVLHL